MQISRKNNTLSITFNGETLTGAMATTRIPKKLTTLTDTENKRLVENEFFLELNGYWATLSDDDKFSLFESYRDAISLCTEPQEVINKHMPQIVKDVLAIHTVDRIKAYLPHEQVWHPETMKRSFDSVCPNFTEEMTYLVEDNYNLVCLALAVRSLIPIYSALGLYSAVNTRNRSVDEKRVVVYKITYAYGLLMSTGVSDDVAMTKLEAYIDESVARIINELKNSKFGGRSSVSSISTIAAFEGFGSEALNDYLRAFAVVHVLSSVIINPIRENVQHMRHTTIAATIHKQINSEYKTNLAKRLTDDSYYDRLPAYKRTGIGGDESKVGEADLVRARTVAPVDMHEMLAVAMLDYRSFIKNIHPDLIPAQVKEHIVSAHSRGPYFVHHVHLWLISAVFKPAAYRQMVSDLDRSEDIRNAIGIAQATYLALGYPELAALLSCSFFTDENNNNVHSFDIMSSELKKELDIYYPQGFNEYDNGRIRIQNPAVENINSLITEHISFANLKFDATDEVKAKLRMETDGDYKPSPRLRNSIAELLIRTCRKELKQLEQN